jgi:hypothetical protein
MQSRMLCACAEIRAVGMHTLQQVRYALRMEQHHDGLSISAWWIQVDWAHPWAWKMTILAHFFLCDQYSCNHFVWHSLQYDAVQLAACTQCCQ